MRSLNENSVDIKDIDFHDISFKMSRMAYNDQLRKSVSVSGILNPPILLEGKEKFKIISGFNRLNAAKDLGLKTVNAFICTSIDDELILSVARQKEYHNEIGPVGKIRLIDVLLSIQNDRNAVKVLLTKEFGIPLYLTDDSKLRNSILNFPIPLLKYIDEKNINFKMMKKLCTLPFNILEKISEWMEYGPLRVNIFRNLIELMDDIFRRDGNIPLFEITKTGADKGRYMFEDELYTYYFSIRYPRFSKKLKEAEELRQKLLTDGFNFNVPQNFEGDVLDLSVNIPVYAEPDKIVHRLSRIDKSLIKALQELLK